MQTYSDQSRYQFCKNFQIFQILQKFPNFPKFSKFSKIFKIFQNFPNSRGGDRLVFKRPTKDGEDLLLGQRVTEQEVRVGLLLMVKVKVKVKGHLENQNNFLPQDYLTEQQRRLSLVQNRDLRSANLDPLWSKIGTNGVPTGALSGPKSGLTRVPNKLLNVQIWNHFGPFKTIWNDFE